MSGDEETLSGALGGGRFPFPCVFMLYYILCVVAASGTQKTADGVAGRSVNEWLSHVERSRGKDIRGLVNTPSPFKWFFQTLSFFSSYRFSKRWLHTLIKEFT